MGGSRIPLPTSTARRLAAAVQGLGRIASLVSPRWLGSSLQSLSLFATTTASSDTMPASPQGRLQRLLDQLLRSFISLWMHPTRTTLFNTMVAFVGGCMWNDVIRGPRESVRDLFIGACVSTVVNFLLQTGVAQALTSLINLQLQYQIPSATSSPSLSTAASASLTFWKKHTIQFLLFIASWLVSVEAMYPLGRLVFRQQQQAEEDRMAALSANANNGPSVPSGASSSPAQQPATTYSPPTAPLSLRCQSGVFLCGGESFVHAISGFRWGYYADAQQLRGFLSSMSIDVMSLMLQRARRRIALRFMEEADAIALSFAIGEAFIDPAAGTTVLTPSATMQLLPIFVCHYLAGAGVGVLLRRRASATAFFRRLPLVGRLLEVVYPSPPPPLKLAPATLLELSPEFRVLLLDRQTGRTEVAMEAAAPSPLVTPSASQVVLSSDAEALQQQGVTLTVPSELFCPIQRTLMTDPVQTCDGFTYNRDGIEEWLRDHDTAPLTNLKLASTALQVNWEVRMRVEQVMAFIEETVRDGQQRQQQQRWSEKHNRGAHNA